MVENLILPIVIALISSGTMSAIVGALIKKMFEENPTNVAIRLLIQDKLIFLCKKAIDEGDGKISLSNWKMIHHLYESYKALHGNGDAEHLMEQINRMQIYIDDPDK